MVRRLLTTLLATALAVALPAGAALAKPYVPNKPVVSITQVGSGPGAYLNVCAQNFKPGSQVQMTASGPDGTSQQSHVVDQSEQWCFQFPIPSSGGHPGKGGPACTTYTAQGLDVDGKAASASGQYCNGKIKSAAFSQPAQHSDISGGALAGAIAGALFIAFVAIFFLSARRRHGSN